MSEKSKSQKSKIKIRGRAGRVAGGAGAVSGRLGRLWSIFTSCHIKSFFDSVESPLRKWLYVLNPGPLSDLISSTRLRYERNPTGAGDKPSNRRPRSWTIVPPTTRTTTTTTTTTTNDRVSRTTHDEKRPSFATSARLSNTRRHPVVGPPPRDDDERSRDASPIRRDRCLGGGNGIAIDVYVDVVRRRRGTTTRMRRRGRRGAAIERRNARPPPEGGRPRQPARHPDDHHCRIRNCLL